jgi:hypothetical protein
MTLFIPHGPGHVDHSKCTSENGTFADQLMHIVHLMTRVVWTVEIIKTVRK